MATWKQIADKIDGLQTAPPLATVFTISGTGVDMLNIGWPQPAAVASAVNQNIWNWQPVGNYPASVVNMGASAQDAVTEVIRLLTGSFGPPPFYTSGPIVILGYSQGAIAACHLFRDHFLKATGILHGRLHDLVGVGVWGNPLRCPGYAPGNLQAGWPMPGFVNGVMTGGISGPDNLKLTQTSWSAGWGVGPTQVMDWVNTIGVGHDLYADCPCGPNPWGHTIFGTSTEAGPGKIETQIYNIVQKATFFNVIEVAKDLFAPKSTVEAIINGLSFATAGLNASHYTYDLTPIIRWLDNLGLTLLAAQS